jgi:hypothetical protein
LVRVSQEAEEKEGKYLLILSFLFTPLESAEEELLKTKHLKRVNELKRRKFILKFVKISKYF